MSIQCYHVSKEGGKSLSKNFKVREFACKDGSDSVIVDSQLVEKLQKLRDKCGKPIVINSAYRTVSHNKKVGGSPTSQHMNGRAADIVIHGLSPEQVSNLAKAVGFNGVGIYNSFVHVDVRDYKQYFDKRTK